jgi:hypothetical protein
MHTHEDALVTTASHGQTRQPIVERHRVRTQHVSQSGFECGSFDWHSAHRRMDGQQRPNSLFGRTYASVISKGI